MPFRVPLDVPVSALAAGEKQKLEILKLLYLDQRLLILDEPTSVLTPDEADEMLGLLARHGAAQGNHRHHDHAQVPRGARPSATASRCCAAAARSAAARSSDLSTDDMARMMIGDTQIRERAVRADRAPGAVTLELAALYADDDDGLPALEQVNLKVHAGEIVGIAGVSGNGQSQLVEVLSGQRPLTDGRIIVKQEPFEPTRDTFSSHEDVRPARGAAEERHRAAHDGRREHGVPHLRPAADREARLVAVAGPDARQGARTDRALSGEDAVAGDARSPTCPAATCSAPCWRASSPATSTC